jgi:hypothetical protein
MRDVGTPIYLQIADFADSNLGKRGDKVRGGRGETAGGPRIARMSDEDGRVPRKDELFT